MNTRTVNQKTKLRFALAIVFATACSSIAMIPEPDTVIYGHLYHRFNQPLCPNVAGEISVLANIGDITLAKAEVLPGTNYFLLRVPMDDGKEPRLPNTAKAGDTLRLLISNSVSEVVFDTGAMYQLTNERGQVVPLDLAVDANVSGIAPDSNNDGIPDYWAVYYGFNPTDTIATLDTDGDGFSNYAEFVVGTDPTDPNSKFTVAVALEPNSPNRLNLTFSPVKSHRTYTILVSDSPTGPWTEDQVIQPTLSEPQTVTVPINNTVPSRFFRILIR